MNTDTVNPQAWLHAGLPFGTGSRRAVLRRPARDSVVAGVAAGLARYLGVDVMIIRLAFVVLTVVGAGIGTGRGNQAPGPPLRPVPVPHRHSTVGRCGVLPVRGAIQACLPTD